MYKGHKIFYHNGAIDGYTTALYWVPDLSFAVVASVNLSNCLLCEAAAADALDQALGHADTDWFGFWRALNHQMFAGLRSYADSLHGPCLPGHGPSHPEDAYVGIYQKDGYRPLAIRKGEQGLTMLLNGFVVPLAHFHYDVFKTEEAIGEMPPGLLTEFFSDAEGRISALRIPLMDDPRIEPLVFRRKNDGARDDKSDPDTD